MYNKIKSVVCYRIRQAKEEEEKKIGLSSHSTYIGDCWVGDVKKMERINNKAKFGEGHRSKEKTY